MDFDEAGLVMDQLMESGFDVADTEAVFEDLEGAAQEYGDGFDAFDIYSARAAAFELDADNDEIMDLLMEEF